MTLLLPALALRAFLGVSPIGTARRTVSHLSVLELCPLNSPRYRASLHSPPEQQSRVHMMAASFCALLTALLPMFVSAGLSSPHSCISGDEKATGSFSLSEGGRKRLRYVALAALLQRRGFSPFSLNSPTKRSPLATNTHAAVYEMS